MAVYICDAVVPLLTEDERKRTIGPLVTKSLDDIHAQVECECVAYYDRLMAAAKAECKSVHTAEIARLRAQSDADILAYRNQLKLDVAAVKDDLHLQGVQALQLAPKSMAHATCKQHRIDPLARPPSRPGESVPTSPNHTPTSSPLTSLHSLPEISAAPSPSLPLISLPPQPVLLRFLFPFSIYTMPSSGIELCYRSCEDWEVSIP